MHRPVSTFIALGSNLGDRQQHIEGALQAIAALPATTVERLSTVQETEPLPMPDPGADPGGAYLNAVALCRTSLPPRALLQALKAIERDRGRDPTAPRFAPRPIDLDILTYGDQRVDCAELRVPHPALHGRGFWREALAELDQDVERVSRWDLPTVVETLGEGGIWTSAWTGGGCTIGLIPTMGALHAGHMALVKRARAECDRVVATVFVNPLQFGEGEDLDRYPKPWDADLRVLRDAGVDLVVHPPAEAVFGDGFCSRISVGVEAEGMEAAVRPGHFAGVATVVTKLLTSLRPTRAYFGQKDAQQVAVLRRLVRDLELPLELVECPTVREPDGLALSSRNIYLDGERRRVAPVLYRALQAARAAFAQGARDQAGILAAAREVLTAEPGVEVEYLELRREGDLAPWPEGVPVSSGRVLAAIRLGPTRLLDNLRLDGPGPELDSPTGPGSLMP